jgi:hypothetical protein
MDWQQRQNQRSNTERGQPTVFRISYKQPGTNN